MSKLTSLQLKKELKLYGYTASACRKDKDCPEFLYVEFKEDEYNRIAGTLERNRAVLILTLLKDNVSKIGCSGQVSEGKVLVINEPTTESEE